MAHTNAPRKRQSQLGARPMRDLLVLLPQLPTDGGDLALTTVELPSVELLAEVSSDAIRTIERGLSVMGVLLANANPEFETGDFPGDWLEVYGWLVSEMADFMAMAHDYNAAAIRELCQRGHCP